MEPLKEWEINFPLRHIWTLWFLENNKRKPWEECLMEVGTFWILEDFWSFFNNVKPVTLIKYACGYSLFKTGIKLMWEDDANVTGGRWLIELNKNLPREKLNRYLLDLSMAMIGQNFAGLNDLICGATVNSRPNGHRIALWLRDTNNENGRIIQIGLTLKESLGMEQGQVIKFQTHLDAKNQDELGRVKTTYCL